MALTTPYADFDFSLAVLESSSPVGIGDGASQRKHLFSFINRYTSGTGANNIGAVWSTRATISGATDYDLSGSLTSIIDGSTVSFPIVMGIFVKNLSTTSGQGVQMGGDAAGVVGWISANSDWVRIGASGFIGIWSPIDGYTVTNATADVLQFAPDAGSPQIDLLVVGRAS